MFTEQQISILEWFPKVHVTLKTEVIAAENGNNISQSFF